MWMIFSLISGRRCTKGRPSVPNTREVNALRTSTSQFGKKLVGALVTMPEVVVPDLSLVSTIISASALFLAILEYKQKR